MVKLDNMNDLMRVRTAKEYFKKLKEVTTEKELHHFIEELKKNGFDLWNRSYGWDSRCFSFMEKDKESLYFTYGVYPICGRATTVKFKNLQRCFYIGEKM